MKKAKFNIDLYRGVHARCLDARQAAVLLENSSISRSVYLPGTVDGVFFDEAVVLHEETAEYLYSKFTSLKQPYAKGSRPFLEKVVARVTAGIKDPRQKAIALNDWVRDMSIMYGGVTRAAAGGGDLFHGGAEEEVIRKGSSMCNEMARVLGVLAQIAGMPSRYIGHMTMINYDDATSGTGHGINEIYVEGKWAYFDIRGRFYLKADGSLASAWDLLQDPGLVDRQGPDVLSHRDLRSGDGWKKYYSPPAVTIVVNYLAADHTRYDYSWVCPSHVRWAAAREVGRAIRTTKHRNLLPQPRPRVV